MRPNLARAVALILVALILLQLWRTETDQVLRDRWWLADAAASLLGLCFLVADLRDARRQRRLTG